jgi:multidrug resistance efflux pump
MTSSDDTPMDPQTEEDVRAELVRVDAELDELRRQVHDLRAEVSEEGAMDAADRTALITQAEELEALAAELERRRDALEKSLGGSS